MVWLLFFIDGKLTFINGLENLPNNRFSQIITFLVVFYFFSKDFHNIFYIIIYFSRILESITDVKLLLSLLSFLSTLRFVVKKVGYVFFRSWINFILFNFSYNWFLYLFFDLINSNKFKGKNPPDCTVFDSWVFVNFVLLNELFPKAFQSIDRCLL